MAQNLGWWLITLHSTITWLTLTRSLGGSCGQVKTLTLYSDPNPFPNQNPNSDPNPTLYTRYPIVARALGRVRRASKGILHTKPHPNPNEKFDLLPYIAMSRDRSSFFAYNFSGKHFNPTSCGVIRNQRSKIRRLNIMLTSGALSEKSWNSNVEWFSTLAKFRLKWLPRSYFSLGRNESPESPERGIIWACIQDILYSRALGFAAVTILALNLWSRLKWLKGSYLSLDRKDSPGSHEKGSNLSLLHRCKKLQLQFNVLNAITRWVNAIAHVFTGKTLDTRCIPF